ncbi:MAG: DUF3034 family protein [Candidatus Omnitrophica bacterium]|nr:DUF3034 family protein [Candidatus Omnitrophota bacterium]MBU4473224.1 DUF3034 family protein [Candidatus Omnitrophota bacterium]MCG2706587.1 DUF3034 family protein [Candidatus Omnitrophota bacterium]
MKGLILVFVISALTAVSCFNKSEAAVPFNNLEGVGGVAFNPLAYLADSDGEDSHFKITNTDIIGKPRFGGWYVNLDDVKVDWTSLGIADTFLKRLEVSYGYETIAQSEVSTKHKNNVGTKLLLIPENSKRVNFIPAVSIGSIWKHTSNVGSAVDASGVDYYLVATKLITQLPRPALLSAGLLSTKGRVTGVFGYDKERKEAGFGNIDLLLTDNIVVGFEYKQGVSFPTFKNANYWQIHIGVLVNNNLSLIAAYVNAGDHKSSSKTGLGDGVVLSAQYSF